MNRCTLIALLPLALAACGGSGNDNGNGNPRPSAAMAINAGNGFEVAQASYQSAASSGDVADFAGNPGLTASAGGILSKPTPSHPGIIDILSRVPIGPLELACEISGTITITADFADPTGQTLSAGDTITTAFDNCNDGVGETLDGVLSSEILAITGDITSDLYELTMRITLDNLQSTIGTDVVLANGDGTATINTLELPFMEATVSGDSMLTSENTSTQTLTDYSWEQTLIIDAIPSPYTLIASGTLDSSELSGSVRYTTPVMFEGFDDNYPYVGEMLIVGDGSSARLIAQSDSTNVVIEIYSNTSGTGTPDSTINTTWVDLADL